MNILNLYKRIKTIAIIISTTFLIYNCSGTSGDRAITHKKEINNIYKIKHSDNSFTKTMGGIARKFRKAAPYALGILGSQYFLQPTSASTFIEKIGDAENSYEINSLIQDSTGIYSLGDKISATETHSLLSEKYSTNGVNKHTQNLISINSLYSVDSLKLENDYILNLGYIYSSSSSQIFLWEQDTTGETVSSTIIDYQEGHELPTSMTHTSDNKILVAGYTTRDANHTNSFIFRYTPSFYYPTNKIDNFRIYSSALPNQIHRIITAQENGYYFAGMVEDNSKDILFGYLNDLLNVQIIKQSGGSFDEEAQSIIQLKNNVILGGYSAGSGHRDMLLDIHNLDGSFNSTMVISGHNNDDEIFDIKSNINDSLIIGGYITHSNNIKGAYISQLLSDFSTFYWEKSAVAPNIESSIKRISITDDNNILAAGFDGQDGFLSKLDNKGDIQDCDSGFFSDITSHILDISPYMSIQEDISYSILQPSFTTIDDMLSSNSIDDINHDVYCGKIENDTTTTTTTTSTTELPISSTVSQPNTTSSVYNLNTTFGPLTSTITGNEKSSSDENFSNRLFKDMESDTGATIAATSFVLGILTSVCILSIYCYCNKKRKKLTNYSQMVENSRIKDNELEMDNIPKQKNGFNNNTIVNREHSNNDINDEDIIIDEEKEDNENDDVPLNLTNNTFQTSLLDMEQQNQNTNKNATLSSSLLDMEQQNQNTSKNVTLSSNLLNNNDENQINQTHQTNETVIIVSENNNVDQEQINENK